MPTNPENLTGRSNAEPQSVACLRLPEGKVLGHYLKNMAQHKVGFCQCVICALLALATFAVFCPLLECDFVNFDDPKYVTSNAFVQRGLSCEGLRWAFTNTHAANWHPLTWLSHMLDVQLFGLNPGLHHLTNLSIHIANVLLLFLVLQRMTRAPGRSAFVAALFALHPLHVESVAWVSERKDVLSAFFFMLTMWAYVKYVEQSRGQKSSCSLFPLPSSLFYLCALLLFALGLMSKPMLVTLPFVLLLLDYWPLERLQTRTLSLLPRQNAAMADQPSNATQPTTNARSSRVWPLLIEKLPFFALSLGSSIITFLAQKSGGAMASLERIPLDDRLMNATVSYLTYIQKMVWPAKLAVLYLPPNQWPLWHLGLALAVLSAVTGAVLGPGRARPYLSVGWFWYLGALIPVYLSVGWFWYLGTLVPVIGLVQVGNQSMADRYTYLPLVGLFLILSWGGWEILETYRHHKAASTFAVLLIVGCCITVTGRQVQFWSDTESLFTQCIRVTQNNHIAHNNLGNALAKKGRQAEARAHYLESLRIQPSYADAWKNMGVLLTKLGQIDEALPYLREGVRLDPGSADVYGKLAFALAAEGKFDGAISYYRECVRLNPDQIEACNNLAWILATNPEAKWRDGQEAVRLAERACQLTGYTNTVPIGTLGAAYAEAGRFSDAQIMAEKAGQLARQVGLMELAAKNEELLRLYQANRPYHAAE